MFPSRDEVDALFQRLVIDAHSLLPRCEMPVARMLLEEWLDEQVRPEDDIASRSGLLGFILTHRIDP
jgi:hypothetical protein